jgi:DNA-binding Lrp family transcriptional regulator
MEIKGIDLIGGGHLDELDLVILNELQPEGRISNAELARRINLSPPATHARRRQLEGQGDIANQLTQCPNIARIQTSIVIRKVKSTTALPLFR